MDGCYHPYTLKAHPLEREQRTGRPSLIHKDILERIVLVTLTIQHVAWMTRFQTPSNIRIMFRELYSDVGPADFSSQDTSWMSSPILTWDWIPLDELSAFDSTHHTIHDVSLTFGQCLKRVTLSSSPLSQSSSRQARRSTCSNPCHCH